MEIMRLLVLVVQVPADGVVGGHTCVCGTGWLL